MFKFHSQYLLSGICLAFLAACQSSAGAADRVALIIGNSNYHEDPLKNPANDVDLMSRVLKNLNFEVLAYKDANLRTMEQALGEYSKRLQPGGLGFFFYAGHGLQMKGENYLAPVDLRSVAKHEIPYRMLNIGMVLEALDLSQANLNVVVLDCCRNNPYQRSWRGRQSGLAAVNEVPEGTILAFSTAPGQLAADGKGANSPYTEQLAQALSDRPQRGLSLVDVFLTASRKVRQQAGQRPWMNLDASIPEYLLWNGETENTGFLTFNTQPDSSAGDPVNSLKAAGPGASDRNVFVIDNGTRLERVGPKTFQDRRPNGQVYTLQIVSENGQQLRLFEPQARVNVTVYSNRVSFADEAGRRNNNQVIPGHWERSNVDAQAAPRRFNAF